MNIPSITCCVCGSEQFVAARPGVAGDTLPNGIVIRQDIPARGWCAEHWPDVAAEFLPIQHRDAIPACGRVPVRGIPNLGPALSVMASGPFSVGV